MNNSILNKDSAVAGVKESFVSPIKVRFETVLKDRGMKWVDVYQRISLSKGYASMIKNGHLIPPPGLRVKIANAIGCDTSVLWEAPDLIPADRILLSKVEQHEAVNSASEPIIEKENGEPHGNC